MFRAWRRWVRPGRVWRGSVPLGRARSRSMVERMVVSQVRLLWRSRMARLGRTWKGTAWQGRADRGLVRLGCGLAQARQGTAGTTAERMVATRGSTPLALARGMVRQGVPRKGAAWSGTARFGAEWQRLSGQGLARKGEASAWTGRARLGPGTARYGSAGRGKARTVAVMVVGRVRLPATAHAARQGRLRPGKAGTGAARPGSAGFGRDGLGRDYSGGAR